MLPYLLAAVFAVAEPSPCPSDLLVENPRIKVVRASDRAFDNNIVTVDVKNQGTAAQPASISQHLVLLIKGDTAGSQPIPALGPDEIYPAAFRFQVKHERKHRPVAVTFHFVIDSQVGPGENCTTANDRLTATL